MSELHDLTLAELAARLRRREVSAVEAARHFLARAAKHDALGAYLATDEAVTLAQAQAADARIAAGDTAPLLGVPLAHKDIFVTRDFASTAASRMLDGYRSPFDSTVTARLAGAADQATRDALIRDKISRGDWRAHVGESRSLFVNAATWGLLVTGKLDRKSTRLNSSHH